MIDSDTLAAIAANPPALTGDQLRAAFGLARRYGHEWANALESIPDSDFEAAMLNGITIAAIGEITAAWAASIPGWESGPRGIQSPSVTQYGDGWSVKHATCTGRTRWQIPPSGWIFVTVTDGDSTIMEWSGPSFDGCPAEPGAVYA